MIFKWESEKDKLKRSMNISPKKKMEWLYAMHEFMRLSVNKKRRKLFYKLRMTR